MPPKQDAETDPVVNEWDVYITPKLAEQLYLLQFPTRQRELPYNEDARNKPREMRVKPKSGFVEMDVPLNTELYYDDRKATEWGTALSQAKSEGTEGYGMAVGFGQTNTSKTTGRPDGAIGESLSEDVIVNNLKDQTLGGQIIRDETGKPNYMIGTFLTDKRELHLTHLDGIVQLRPQFHHIDAKSQVERNKVRRERETGEATTAKSHAVQVSYSSADPEQSELATTKTLLQAAQDESWQRLQYHDEEEAVAYTSYNDYLFLAPDRQAIELVSAMNNERYLDAISAPRLDHKGNARVKPMTKKQKAAIELSDNEADGEAASDRVPPA